MSRRTVLHLVAACLLSLDLSNGWTAESGSRRSQRVTMEQTEVVSPDGKIRWTFLPSPERLTFTVERDGTVVIEPSILSMRLDGFDLSSGVVLRETHPLAGTETFPWRGNFSSASTAYRGVRFDFEHDLSLIPFQLEVRVFNDGVAYRHLIPGEANPERFPDEESTFVLPAQTTVWYAGLAAGHYEDTYRERQVSEVPPGDWAGPPLTFRLPEKAGYGAICEANLADYSGMGLEADGRRGWIVRLGHRHPLNYPFELRYGRDEGRRLGHPAGIAGEVVTPWRVILIGPDLDTLVRSAVLPALCPPPDPALFPDGPLPDWIRPGRAVWRYLDGGVGGSEGVKEFSRLAGQLGFEYQVVEGFWSRWSAEERNEVVEFSKAQGVGLWFWKHSNQLRTPEARDSFFRLLRDAGVVGAKIDFMDHEHKEVIDLYETLLRKAAEYRILVNFHGANKPSGRERTLPNDIVREAVKGMESSRFRERARHQTILPFTRYLAGAADYTAMIFSERRGDTTWANQIASLAILNSPLLTVAAHPQRIIDHPAVDLIRSIPPVWDATRVLPESEIGELAAYVRRSGDSWFAAAMCGPRPRSFELPLRFLDDGSYHMELVRDGTASDSVVVERREVRRGESLRVELGAGGGWLARFRRKG